MFIEYHSEVLLDMIRYYFASNCGYYTARKLCYYHIYCFLFLYLQLLFDSCLIAVRKLPTSIKL